MPDLNDLNFEKHPVSSERLESPYGYAVWQWSGTQWQMIKDVSQESGVPQAPTKPGQFVGQLRFIVSRPANS